MGVEFEPLQNLSLSPFISRLFMDYLIGLCKCLIFHSLRKMATVLDLPQVHTHTHMHIVT